MSQAKLFPRFPTIDGGNLVDDGAVFDGQKTEGEVVHGVCGSLIRVLQTACKMSTKKVEKFLGKEKLLIRSSPIPSGTGDISQWSKYDPSTGRYSFLSSDQIAVKEMSASSK
jgi:hypothetical protein